MKPNISTRKIRKRNIAFSLETADAQKVDLVGKFNNWKAGAHPMKKNKTGKWVKPAMLPPGQFEYKFLVDNKWVIDPQNERKCDNCFGTQNNIVQFIQ
jgi:1,4-alpha-glucan branching enzyme